MNTSYNPRGRSNRTSLTGPPLGALRFVPMGTYRTYIKPVQPRWGTAPSAILVRDLVGTQASKGHHTSSPPAELDSSPCLGKKFSTLWAVWSTFYLAWRSFVGACPQTLLLSSGPPIDTPRDQRRTIGRKRGPMRGFNTSALILAPYSTRPFPGP